MPNLTVTAGIRYTFSMHARHHDEGVRLIEGQFARISSRLKTQVKSESLVEVAEEKKIGGLHLGV